MHEFEDKDAPAVVTEESPAGVPKDHPIRTMRPAQGPQAWVQAARDEEGTVSKVQRMVDGALRTLTDWLRPQAPGEMPVPTQLAAALSERVSLHDWLNYRDFDDENDLVYMTAADTFRVGFVLGFSPLLVAGTDIESQLEALLTNCPQDSVVQFGILSSTQTDHQLTAWLDARLRDNKYPLLQELALRRKEFFDAAANHSGTLTYGGTTFQPRRYFYYVSVSVPYNGQPDDESGMEQFLKNIVGMRATMEGALKGASIPAEPLNRNKFEALMIELLNPQLTPTQRRDMLDSPVNMPANFIDRESRISVQPDGNIKFSSMKEGAVDIVASILTMDAPPAEGWLPNTSKLLGHPLSRDDRITCPFWMHTTILVQNPDKARDRITMKLGSLNKQMMSDSPWYRSMMGHLYTQKDELDGLLEAARLGHSPMRVWSGIVLYNTPEKAKRETEYVANLWRKASFRCSQERYISLPVFLSGLPMMYDPALDPPTKGLQRANTVNSFNAATLAHVQGDWSGSHASRGGPLLVSRRGQLATMDLFDTSSNYNFVVVAQSGSGKSFFANELAVDFLSRNGTVRIFDVGRSYKRFASINGGTVLEFSPDNPVSLNPYSGITTYEELYELMPMLKSLIRQMAFPLTDDESFETQFNWQYAAIEQAITAAWEAHREDTGLAHVYHWMVEQEDQRYQDLGFCLHSYAVGRYSAWFNGPRQVQLDNDLIIVELEDLEVDPDLQAVVLTLMIHQITKDMYLSDPERKRPKLLLVDEAWRLLGDKQSGGFISKAFRTVRKYRGSAGAITQSFADFANSAAARAALENATWQFVLKQKPSSVDFAASQEWIPKDSMFTDLLKTVNSDTAQGFSEIFVQGENGQGVYRFVTDLHSYWMYTSHPKDLAVLAEVQSTHGYGLLEAVDFLAREGYRTRKHAFEPAHGSLVAQLREKYEKASSAEQF
jgi:conjugal transfer ATP-binding protein TraC